MLLEASKQLTPGTRSTLTPGEERREMVDGDVAERRREFRKGDGRFVESGRCVAEGNRIVGISGVARDVTDDRQVTAAAIFFKEGFGYEFGDRSSVEIDTVDENLVSASDQDRWKNGFWREGGTNVGLSDLRKGTCNPINTILRGINTGDIYPL